MISGDADKAVNVIGILHYETPDEYKGPTYYL